MVQINTLFVFGVGYTFLSTKETAAVAKRYGVCPESGRPRGRSPFSWVGLPPWSIG